MKLLYKSNRVKKICTDEKKAVRDLGEEVAIKLFQALNLLESVINLKEILAFPQYKLHVLKGNLGGIYSMYLGKKTGYRLLLIPLDEEENPIKCNDISIYTIAVCVEIIEVSKHYE